MKFADPPTVNRPLTKHERAANHEDRQGRSPRPEQQSIQFQRCGGGRRVIRKKIGGD